MFVEIKTETMKFKRNWRTLLENKSQLDKIKNIEKRNKAFHKLPKKQQRIEVALDVLSLMNLESIQADAGNFWSCGMIDELDNQGPEELQSKVLDDEFLNRAKCHVCVRGAMTLSIIRMGNKISTKGDEYENDIDEVSNGQEQQNYFTHATYQAMEIVFEDWSIPNARLDYREKYADYPYKDGSNECLANIFIQIANTGEFKLTNQKDYLSKILK